MYETRVLKSAKVACQGRLGPYSLHHLEVTPERLGEELAYRLSTFVLKENVKEVEVSLPMTIPLAFEEEVEYTTYSPSSLWQYIKMRLGLRYKSQTHTHIINVPIVKRIEVVNKIKIDVSCLYPEYKAIYGAGRTVFHADGKLSETVIK